MWSCIMCGISLDDAVKRLSDPLSMTPDEIIDGMGREDERIKQYVWQRTQSRPKKTCSKICGFNYASHLKSLDPIHTYTNKSISCPLCNQKRDGGRLHVVSGKRAWICRPCHRKFLTKNLQSMWEELHRDERNEYKRKRTITHHRKALMYHRRYAIKKGIRYHRKRAWSLNNDFCLMCGSNLTPHRAHGFCQKCYHLLLWQGGYFK